MLSLKNEVTGEVTYRPAYMLDDAQHERVNRKTNNVPTQPIPEQFPINVHVAVHVFCLPEQYSSLESIAKSVIEYSVYNLNVFKTDETRWTRFINTKLSSILNNSSLVDTIHGSNYTSDKLASFRDLTIVWFCTSAISIELVESARRVFQSARGLLGTSRSVSSEPVSSSLEFTSLAQADAEVTYFDRYVLN